LVVILHPKVQTVVLALVQLAWVLVVAVVLVLRVVMELLIVVQQDLLVLQSVVWD
jgi:hypothetical protein